MKEFAKTFYSSKAWKSCREAYRKRVGGLCERCLSRGLYNPGEIVHHRTPLSPENIKDPKITLAFDNLELLCRDCHAAEHERASARRFKVDKMGRVTAKEDPPMR